MSAHTPNTQWPCPDFELAQLRKVRPAVFNFESESATEADALVLSLALAYNDLKDLEWMHQQLENCKPADEQMNLIDAAVGQWIGMRVHVSRWILGVAHEILRAIGDAHHRGHDSKKKPVAKHPRILGTVRALKPGAREYWTRVVEAARGNHPDKDLRRYLKRTRNRAAFHYNYGTDLVEGYRRAFSPPLTERNRFAYLSLGNSLKATRFFFADAAVQQVFAGRDDLDELFKESTALLETVMNGLAGFIGTYVAERQRTLDAEKREEG